MTRPPGAANESSNVTRPRICRATRRGTRSFFPRNWKLASGIWNKRPTPYTSRPVQADAPALYRRFPQMGSGLNGLILHPSPASTLGLQIPTSNFKLPTSTARPGGGTGRRDGLRIHWPRGLAGSNPVPGTFFSTPCQEAARRFQIGNHSEMKWK